ncbi:MAG: glycoside hydrolase family 3 protein [Flavobacteriaceae bacterium]|jgi:beta-glucosidase|tara:strand:+ start:3598 stop:5616 length:2019 start_codon:yes stop_codon:yes gene_type:complete
MRFSFILLTLLSLTACSTLSNDKDASVIAEKVSNILDQMTLAEKVGQMTQVDLRMFDDINDIKTYHIGSVLSGGSGAPKNNTPKDWLDMVNGFQKIAMGNRLAIPIIYGVDAVHGHNNLLGATVFPHNIALGAANDADLVFRVNKATAIEVAATGIHWTFSPCVAVPQDPRWGRFYEGFGQTSAIVNGLTTAAVNGYQALLKDTGGKQVAACAKHFVGDGGTIWGTGTEVDGLHSYLIDQGDVQLEDAALRELHLPPYERAIAADVKTIMVSFSSLRGQKCHGSNLLINDLLKDDLGFKGFVVSDWGGINQIPGDYKSDVINGINAGIDMVMVPGIRQGDSSYAKNKHYKTFIKYLIDAVNEGSVSIARIDDAVSRILKVKMEIGLFDNPFIDDAYLDQIGSLKHRALAREAVQKSTILLKNMGSLPMSKNETITVVGSAANNLGIQNGGWTTDWQGIFTPDFAFLDYNADGKLTSKEYYSQLKKVYESKFEKNNWTTNFKEIDLDNDGLVVPEDFTGFMQNRVLQPNGTTILKGILQVAPDANVTYSPNATTIAEGSIVLAVVGEYPYAEGYGDDGDLSLNLADQETLNRVIASGNTLIVLMISGRPLLVHDKVDEFDAFVASFLPGMAGEGIADVLFGDTQPKAKLNFIWPKSSDGLGVLYELGSGLDYD